MPATVLALFGAAMATGVGLMFMAWKLASVTFGVVGVVLLLAAPLLAVVALPARKSASQTPVPMRAQSLIEGMHYSDSTLRVIGWARAHLGVAVVSTFLAWIIDAADLADLREFAWCLTLLVAIATAGYLPWLTRQEKLVREHREVLRNELDAVRISEKWFAG